MYGGGAVVFRGAWMVFSLLYWVLKCRLCCSVPVPLVQSLETTLLISRLHILSINDKYSDFSLSIISFAETEMLALHTEGTEIASSANSPYFSDIAALPPISALSPNSPRRLWGIARQFDWLLGCSWNHCRPDWLLDCALLSVLVPLWSGRPISMGRPESGW